MVYLPSMEGKLKAAELLAWRKKRSLTRRELADALGTTVTAVYRWETAARKIPPFLHLALKWLEKEGGDLRAEKGKKPSRYPMAEERMIVMNGPAARVSRKAKNPHKERR